MSDREKLWLLVINSKIRWYTLFEQTDGNMKQPDSPGDGQMNFILSNLKNPALGPMFAAFAGLLASTSPCAMAAVPLMIGHIASVRTGDRKNQLVLFIVGMSTALSLTGIVAGLLGRSLIFSIPWIRWVAGIVIVIVGLSYIDVFSFSKTCKLNIPQGVLFDDGIVNDVSQSYIQVVDKDKVSRNLKSIGLGVLYGLSASPCSTPALIAILAVVATTGSLVRGVTLLLGYSLGQSVLVIFAGLFTSKFTKFLENQRNIKTIGIVRKVGGLIVVSFGVYLLLRPFF